MKLLKKLYTNVPLTEALSQIPTYGMFLKEILSNKREDNETLEMVVDSSTIF